MILDQQNNTHILELVLIKSNSHTVSLVILDFICTAISVEIVFVANWLIMVKWPNPLARIEFCTLPGPETGLSPGMALLLHYGILNCIFILFCILCAMYFVPIVIHVKFQVLIVLNITLKTDNTLLLIVFACNNHNVLYILLPLLI